MKKVYYLLLLCGLVSWMPSTLHAEDTIQYSLCGMDFRPIAMHNNLPAHAIYADTHAAPEARANDVVKRLTFDEKLALTGGLHEFYFPGVARLGIPPVYFADATQGVHEKDICTKVLKTTAFPSGQTLAATWNPEMAYKYARAISEECRAWGVSVLLGPGLNLYRNSEGGRNFEYFGEDPYLASRIGVGYVKGMQSLGTVSTIKHFLGNEQEFVRHADDARIDQRALYELYLAPFKTAIQQGGAMAVMTGNNFVNGHPGSADTPLSEGVLRKEFGFKGIIMSDWANSMFWPDRQAEILGSGHSLLMENNDVFAKYVQTEIAAHPEKKAAIEQDLDKMVAANLYTFFQSGDYDRPYRDPSLVANIESHQAIALQTAEEGITLLKNQDNILPLVPEKVTKIAVIGTPEALTVYGGKGSGAVAGYNHIDFMAGLKSVYGEKAALVDANNEAAIKSADVVLYFINKKASESTDVPYDVPGLGDAIDKYSALNKNLVLIISAGNGLPMPWLPKVKGLVFAYFLGQQRGAALANVLSGKVDPSGKLPFSIEKSFKDSPAYDYNKLPDGTYDWGGGRGDSMKAKQKFGMLAVHYNEGVYIGYRWFDKQHIATIFPFGFGLSYTAFVYSDVKISGRISDASPAIVSFTIKNTGSREGAEVAQVYIHDTNTAVDRPSKELKGFRKVFLSPGESKQVQLPISAQDIAFWSAATSKWKSGHGAYEVLVGSSSQDIRGKAIVRY